MSATQGAHGIFAELETIPPPEELYRVAAALHVLETIEKPKLPTYALTGNRQERRFHYHHPGGNDLYVFFSRAGTLIRGFDHESQMNVYDEGKVWPGLYGGLPAAFRAWTRAQEDELAGNDEHGDELAVATFAAWSTPKGWSAARHDIPAGDDDGAGWLLLCVTGEVDYGEEDDWSPALVAKIAAHQPITDQELRELKKDVDIPAVRAAMEAVGYGRGYPFA